MKALDQMKVIEIIQEYNQRRREMVLEFASKYAWRERIHEAINIRFNASDIDEELLKARTNLMQDFGRKIAPYLKKDAVTVSTLVRNIGA